MKRRFRKEYRVSIQHEDGRWIVTFDELPIFTYGVSLPQAKGRAWDALGCHFNRTREELEGLTSLRFNVDLPELGGKLLLDVRRSVRQVKASQVRMLESQAKFIRGMLGAGMSSTDIGEVLGVSRQRAYVLMQNVKTAS